MSENKTTKTDLLRQEAKLQTEIDGTAASAEILERRLETMGEADRLRAEVLPVLLRRLLGVRRRLEVFEEREVEAVEVFQFPVRDEIGEYFQALNEGRVA
jgi:hypothetical protein